jgi:hypothetical protein
MVAMASCSANRSLFANSIGAMLDRRVPPEWRTFEADLRVKVGSVGLYTYVIPQVSFRQACRNSIPHNW